MPSKAYPTSSKLFSITKFSIKAVTIIFLVILGAGGRIKLDPLPAYKNILSHKDQTTVSTN